MDTILAYLFTAFVIGWSMGIVTYDLIMKLAVHLVRIESKQIEKGEKG